MGTKSVTEFALLIGSTWQTNSLVFSVILAMVLAANLMVMKVRRRLHLPSVYALLLCTLALNFVWPVSSWAGRPAAGTIALAAASLGIPIFLAAIIFATSFRKVKLGSGALASNLLGATVGGCLEYTTLIWGNRVLVLIAFALYALSGLSYGRTSSSVGADGRAHVEPADLRVT